jgi:cell division protein FtsB
MIRAISGVAAIWVIGLVALAFWGPDGLRKHAALRAQIRDLRTRNAELVRQNERLATRLGGLRRHPDALRAVIRDELGWVAPHEVVVQFRSTRHGRGGG